jgi:ribonuclease E
MSRQRLRTGMLEGSTKPCPVCQGTGMVRSVESVALDILRSIEDRLITDGVVPLVATTAVDVALYILNQKRAHLNDIQLRYRIPITVTADENMHVSQFVIERAAEGEIANGGGAVVHMDWAHHNEAPEVAPPAKTAPPQAAEGDSEQKEPRSRRRRRRGRRPEGGGERQRPPHAHAQVHAHTHSDEREDEEEHDQREESVTERAGEESRAAESKGENGKPNRKGPRRRGRRGGRRGRSGQRAQQSPGEEAHGDAPPEAHKEAKPSGESDGRQNGAGRQKRSDDAPSQEVQQPHHEAERVLATVARASEKPPASSEPRVEGPAEPESPRRRGWWQR